jgi:hypothetical protein
VLVILIACAKEDGTIDGSIPHLDGGVSILHYVDDIIIFMEHNLEKGFKYEVDSLYLQTAFGIED